MENNTSTDFGINADTNLRLYTGFTERMRLDSGGNVGIGTTSPDSILEASSGISNFIIRSTTAAASASIDFQPAGGASTSNQNKFTIRAGGLASTLGERLEFLNGNMASLMTIASSGNVGIGTTGPTSKFEVSGNAASQNTISAVVNSTNTVFGVDYNAISAINTNTTVNNMAVIGFSDAVGGSNGAAIVGVFKDHPVNNGELVFMTRVNGGSGERMRITSNGNVGIGTTTPSSLLTVQGRGEFQGTASASYLLTGNTLQVGGFASAAYSRFGTSTTTHSNWISTASDLFLSNDFEGRGSISFAGTASLSNTLWVSPGGYSGNVGIGTTGPGAKLHSLATTEQLRLGYDASNYTSFTVGSNGALTIAGVSTPNVSIAGATPILNIGTSGFPSITFNNREFAQEDNGATLVTIGQGYSNVAFNNSGNVGIGTTAPTDKLYVAGGITAEDNVVASGSVFIGRGKYNATSFGLWGPQDGASGDGNISIAPRNMNSSNGSYITLGQRDSTSDKGSVNLTSGYDASLLMFGDIKFVTGGDSTVDLSIQDTGEVVVTNALQVAGTATQSYSRFGTSTTGHSNYISASNDLLVSGDLETIGSVSLGNNALTITAGGNVGIGTTVPADVLHVVGDIRTSACASDGAGDVACVDVAETFPVSDNMEAGDLVGVDTNFITTASNSFSIKKTSAGMNIMGVISTSPAILIEGNQSRLGGPKVAGAYAPGSKAPVALAGRVPVKVSLENGPIEAGDRLTSSSVPGVAMKTTKAGMTIGMALEPLDAVASGSYAKILTFVNLGYWAPSVDVVASAVASASSSFTVTSSGTGITDVMGTIASAVLTKVQSLWASGDIIAEGIKKTYYNTRTVLVSQIGEFDLASVFNNWLSREITISPNADTATRSLFSGSAAQAADQSKVDLQENGSYLATYGVDSTRVETQLSGSSKLVFGEAKIYFDYSFTSLISDKAPIRVLITPTSNIRGQIYVDQKSIYGFTVKELNGADDGAGFDWLVIARRKGFDSDISGTASSSLNLSPSPSPTESSAPSPTPLPSESPSSTPAPSPSDAPTPTPEPTPSPSSTPEPTPSPTPTPESTSSPTIELPTPEPSPEI